jgi:hypothetical protein
MSIIRIPKAHQSSASRELYPHKYNRKYVAHLKVLNILAELHYAEPRITKFRGYWLLRVKARIFSRIF